MIGSQRIQNQTGKLASSAETAELYNDDLRAVNSFENQSVKPARRSLACEVNGLDYTFPPHSVTVLCIPVEE